tara:strand:- start:128 stop:403 length:276 start_codon:yes stop_codon:yes gene_type:complete
MKKILLKALKFFIKIYSCLYPFGKYLKNFIILLTLNINKKTIEERLIICSKNLNFNSNKMKIFITKKFFVFYHLDLNIDNCMKNSKRYLFV